MTECFLSEETLTLVRKKRRAFKLARRFGKHQHFLCYRSISNKVRDSTRRDHLMHIEQITSDLDKGQRSFWRWLKKMRPGQWPNIPDIHYQGKSLTSPIQKAKAFCKFFTSVFVHENEATLAGLKDDLANSRSLDELVEISVTKEVYNLLRTIDPSKSSGPDDVPGRLLKEGAEWLAEPLANLFSLSLSKGALPCDWTSANVSSSTRKATSTQCPTTAQLVSPVLL